jgi:hypothetical protein
MDDGTLYFPLLLIALVLAWMFIPLKKSENEPTTRNYWTNMNLCNEYTEEIHNVKNLKEEKKQEITYLQSSLRKSTLRNRNQNVEYATEEDIQQAREELQNVEKTLIKLRKCQYRYYLKTKEITREMNRRGMWELSKESHIENWWP